eukprot:gene8202-1464_t
MIDHLPSIPDGPDTPSRRVSLLVKTSSIKKLRDGTQVDMALPLKAPPLKAKTPTFEGPRRLSPAARSTQLMNLLLGELETKWKDIRSLNLGIKSGTGVVDDLTMTSIQAQVKELNMLCISREEAADAIGKVAQKLKRTQLQQLQLLFDVMGHDYLADYIRVMVYNTADPMAKVPVDRLAMPKKGKKSTKAAITIGRKQSTGLHNPSQAPEARMKPERDEVLRFAGFLPENHPLSQKAYGLYLSRLPDTRVLDRKPAGDDNGDGGGMSEAEIYAERHGVRQALHEAFYEGRAKDPDEEKDVPMYMSIEERWKATTHTIVKDETVCNTIMISDTLPAWLKQPEYKTKHLEELHRLKLEAVQAASSPTRAGRRAGHTPMSSTSLNGLHSAQPSPKPGTPLATISSLKPVFGGDTDSEAGTPRNASRQPSHIAR